MNRIIKKLKTKNRKAKINILSILLSRPKKENHEETMAVKDIIDFVLEAMDLSQVILD